MKKVEIRWIGLGSVFRLYLVIGVVVGLLVNVVLLLGGLALWNIGQDLGTMNDLIGIGGGAVGCIVLAILYGLLSGVSAVVAALLYNIFAAAVGGVKVNLSDRD